jgi:hypothetical protein
MLEQQRNLSGDDLLWLYNATSDAFASIKDVHKKSKGWIDGEVFTYLRRVSRESPSVSRSVKALFYGKMKKFTHRLDGRTTQKDKELLVAMYDSIRSRTLKGEPDPLTGLEQALLAMQASARKAEEVAAESAKMREGLENIRALLEDKEPLCKEENVNE